MTNTNKQQELDIPFSKIDEWEAKLKGGVCAAFWEAARWGADQELEACCEWVNDDLAYDVADRLRAARRSKPPSLNDVALQMLSTIERDAHYLPEITDTIRRALEQLDD